MHRNRSLPRWRLVMLAAMILTGLAMPAPTHAASLAPAYRAALNRDLKGLLLQGTPVDIATQFVGLLGLCYRDTPQMGSDCDFKVAAALQPDLGNNWTHASGIGGRWRVYDAYMRRWGMMTVNQDKYDNYSGVLTASTGGAASFTFFASENQISYLSADSYDFTYNTSDDHGYGFVQWMPDGCTMQGIFQSAFNKDPNTGQFITSFVIFRRC